MQLNYFLFMIYPKFLLVLKKQAEPTFNLLNPSKFFLWYLNASYLFFGHKIKLIHLERTDATNYE